jgi:hypothetical protein
MMATVATLIGRRTELETLEALLDGARDGRSGVLVVRGVPGVGKSALLDHCARAATGFRVLRAEGVEAEAELAFAGLHQLVRPLLGRLDRLPALQRAALEAAFGVRDGVGGDRFLVAAGTLGLLAEAAEEQPLLCVVDDLQWLDRPSADALLFAARRLDAEPIAVLLAVRADGPPLAHLPALTLAGLTREDAGELLDRSLLSAERERLLDVAEGIPLALLELSRGPHGAMSAVEKGFADRIAALPEAARRALLLAAVDDDPSAATALAAGVRAADLAPAEAGTRAGRAPRRPGPQARPDRNRRRARRSTTAPGDRARRPSEARRPPGHQRRQSTDSEPAGGRRGHITVTPLPGPSAPDTDRAAQRVNRLLIVALELRRQRPRQAVRRIDAVGDRDPGHLHDRS